MVDTKPTEDDLRVAEQLIAAWEQIYKPADLRPFNARTGLVKRVARALAEQREADAKIAENYHFGKLGSVSYLEALIEVATAIRAGDKGVTR